MTTSYTQFTRAQFARPLRIAIVVLICTALTRTALEHLGRPTEPLELPVRAGQVLLLLAIGAIVPPRRSERMLLVLGFAVSVTVALANLAVAAVNPSQTWSSVTVVAAVTMGAALLAPWSWRWQAALCAVLSAAAAGTTVFLVPRAAFPWPEGAVALFLITAVGVGSIWGKVLVEAKHRRMFASEARYRSLFESAGDAIAVLDEDGIIRQANASLATLLGRPLERIVGRTLDSFHARAGVGGAAEHRAALGGRLQRGTHTFAHSDGHPIEAEVSYARTPDAATPQVQAIVHDLTEHRALERRAIKDQRLDALG